MDKIVIVSLAIIIFFHVLFGTALLYDSILWLDIVMHLAGGAWVALAYIFIFKHFRFVQPAGEKLIPSLINTLGAVILIGVLWEFYEYLIDVYIYKLHPLGFASNPRGLPDTLDDLFNDLLGGLSVFSVYYFYNHKRVKNGTGDKNSSVSPKTSAS